MVLPFWYRPTRLDPGKGPLHGCVFDPHCTYGVQGSVGGVARQQEDASVPDELERRPSLPRRRLVRQLRLRLGDGGRSPDLDPRDARADVVGVLGRLRVDVVALQ